MSGKIIAIFLVCVAIIGGATTYYLQVFAYYDRIEMTPEQIVALGLHTNTPENIDAHAIQAIDKKSSPIGFRACFATNLSLDTARTRFVASADAVPNTGPAWFDCYDANDLGAQLASGDALAFVTTKNIAFGVDRLTAITKDGRGFMWHQLNNCGEKRYDGTIIGEECPIN